MAQKVAHKLFHSKILLFGEQIINKGAMGLAAPVEQFDGMFKFGDLKNRQVLESNRSLEQLAHHLVHTYELSGLYNTNAFLEDLEKGLYFDSNIPQGYGLGSSGALVAAVYYQYRKKRSKNYVIAELKKELADLENYFHGKSSGLDALVCYLNKAVLVANGEIKRAFDLGKPAKPAYKVFLLNTRQPRSTSTFVNLFLEKCKEPKFMNAVNTSLIPANNIAIESFIAGKYIPLLNSVKLISQLQYDMLPEFIPSQFKEAWRSGLKHNEYHLKICGAGGGGFIIGFAKADANLGLLLVGKEVTELMQF